MPVKAITFDFWDTIVRDDSDEADRRSRGLRSKRDERRYQVWETLNADHPVSLEDVTLAYDTAEAGFNVVWKDCYINWTVEQRLRVVLGGLGRELSPDRLGRLVEAHGRMEVEIPPLLVEGVGETLETLSKSYKLAIVSDAIVTPGVGLREILAGYGLKDHFSAFAFSDEIGRSKPHRSMFDSVASQLGIGVDDLVHIGDRDHNDVKGPQALGAKAILFTGSRAADKEATTADAICERYEDLPQIVAGLASQDRRA